MPHTFDPCQCEYPSRRNVVYSTKGMVATGNPLASQAGLDILKLGGNAVDAAIATAITLSVVKPTSNGIGGDAFALVWMNDKLHGLNSSGFAPALLDAERLRSEGYTKLPEFGVLPVTVPGAPAAWAELSKRFGKLPFEQLFATAIDYAENGYVLQPSVSTLWERSFEKYEEQLENYPVLSHWFDTFTDKGRCYRAGDVVKLPHHAKTLRALAATNCESFYRGPIADAIGAFMEDEGGLLRASDLAAFTPEWVEPLSASYEGYEVYELPPNGHGITVLMALNILKNLSLGDKNSFESTHYQIEALKLAYSDVQKYVADPVAMRTKTSELLSEEYAKERSRFISDTAISPQPGDPPKGGTVYLCTADSEGNMVSFIQSNYTGFGSGVVVPDTGIALHNRGCNFSLDSASDNCAAPRKRPYHTIIPGFLTKGGKPVGPFGIMGAFMQPQAHLQVLVNTIDYQMNPQQALDRPRWMWVKEKTVEIEQCFPEELEERLRAAGHDVHRVEDLVRFGSGEIIWRSEEGVLCGACESRTDGCVAAW